MFKKSILISLWVAADAVFAGSMGPSCIPGQVTVPCEIRQWDLGIQALNYSAVYDVDKGYALTPFNQFKELNNEWDWGYRLEGSYHMSTGNDITLDWSHYDAPSSLGQFIDGAPVGFLPGFNTYNLYMTNRFDQANLVFGQQADLGAFQHTRFYGGLQYAQIRADGNLAYISNLPSANPITFSRNRNADFKGVGPVVGVDFAYELGHAFSLIANTQFSILYGTSRYQDAVVVSNALVVSAVDASKKAIVPSFELKLGADYAYSVAQGILHLEGGYHVLNYFNAIEAMNLAQTDIHDSNFALYGPYLGLKWVANV